MKVYITDIIKKRDKDGSNYTMINGRLQSGLEIIIKNVYYDFQDQEGQQVEMLLSVMRSPYLELQRGLHNKLFGREDFYSVELIDELLGKKGLSSKDDNECIMLNGEYINSYIVPEKWTPFMWSGFFKILPKKLSALKTSDGIFLLNPIHLRRASSTEVFPRIVTIATGYIRLIAWYPLPAMI